MNIERFIELAQIHKQRVPDLLSCFAIEDIVKFYQDIESDPDNFIITAEENNSVCGFAFFTIKTKKFIKEYFRRKKIKIITRLFTCPGTVLMLLKSIFMKSVNGIAPGSASLCQIAVSPGHEGKGIGRHLIGQGEIWLRQRSISEYYLTVNQQNIRAAEIYRKSGFTEKTNDGNHIIMIKKL